MNNNYGLSRGNALERRIVREIEQVKKKSNDNDGSLSRLELLKVIEINESKNILPLIKEDIKRNNNDYISRSELLKTIKHYESNTERSSTNENSTTSLLWDNSNNKHAVSECVQKSKKRYAYRTATDDMESNKKPKLTNRLYHPEVTPTSLTKTQIKLQTGFNDSYAMICFIIIICNGNIDLMTRTNCYMTWYEEWFSYFEFQYGRTATTIRSLSALFRIHQNAVAKIINDKLKLVVAVQNRWPRYVTIREDEFLKSSKWKNRFVGKRVIFHDNTGIDIATPSNSLLQRITYSSYYGGNVAKGGVFIQQCGWIGAYDLYPGAMSDSDYFINTGILEYQNIFQKEDDGQPFINALDRGYRVTKAAWKLGQFILQPIFAKSDRQFTTIETLKAASVAADRSGNERSVRTCKMANIFSNHAKHGNKTEDVRRLCDFWIAHGFQVNFMYKNVM